MNLGKLGNTPTIPPGTAQFTVNIRQVYTDGTNEVDPTTLAANLQDKQPVFVFGASPYDAGFSAAFKELKRSTGGWTYIKCSIYNKPDIFIAPGADQYMEPGDLIFEYIVPGAPPPFFRYIIVSVKGVAYGTLLKSLMSDQFTLNNIKVQINDAAHYDQFDQTLMVLDQSLFGKRKKDTITPSELKKTGQFQDGIINIPLTKSMDKRSLFGCYLNYNIALYQWSIFVKDYKTLT